MMSEEGGVKLDQLKVARTSSAGLAVGVSRQRLSVEGCRVESLREQSIRTHGNGKDRGSRSRQRKLGQHQTLRHPQFASLSQ